LTLHIKQITITVESEEQVETIQNLLQEAEEECIIDFPFNTKVEDVK